MNLNKNSETAYRHHKLASYWLGQNFRYGLSQSETAYQSDCHLTHSPLNIFRKFVSRPQLAIYFLPDNKKTREVAHGGEFDKILISNSQKGYNFVK